MARYGKRRRHSRGWIAVALIIVLLTAAYLLFTQVFVVRNVEVMGDASASEESVIRAAHIDFGSSIFFINEAEIRSAIAATGTMYLESMQVRRPDSVLLQVRERTRNAMLLHMGEIRILDEEGCVVESMEDVPDMDLVYVNGMRIMRITPGEPVQAAEGQIEAYSAVMRALKYQGASMYVSELEVGDVENLRVITRTGITVELGDAGNMENKIAWLKSAIADLENRGEGGGTLDVRSGNKADYRRSGAANS